ncbi:MAG TPA: hypothetical protein P5307_27595, partial [Pirellulaceae bacterium]|nr:hypothetical protein [Pirellulaceae bacterium]
VYAWRAPLMVRGELATASMRSIKPTAQSPKRFASGQTRWTMLLAFERSFFLKGTKRRNREQGVTP